MADFSYLVYYKDHPSDRAPSTDTRNHGSTTYQKTSKRHRGTSECATLDPVMEQETEEVGKKSKRRFSLDFIFSRRRKSSTVLETEQRGSVDSTASAEYDSVVLNPDSQTQRRKSSADSVKTNQKNAGLTAYCFS